MGLNMGMSTHVVGFKPPDAKWRLMKAVYEACAAAGIDPPGVVTDYFGDETPDDNGVEITEEALTEVGAICAWSDEYSEGYEIDVQKLPADVTIVRVFNSW
jgi:hypothetical protein